MMSILKSLVAAPLLICGFAIFSPVSANPASEINHVWGSQPVGGTISKAGEEKLEKFFKSLNGKPGTVNHIIKLDELKKMGCEGSIRYGCNVKHRIVVE